MTDFECLQFTREGAIAIITLGRPDAANGLNPQMGKDLIAVSARCASDPSIRAVILTATGRFFSAGGDVKTMASMGDDVAAGIKGLADDLHRAISTFARMRAPLICAVNGVAAGAGFSLAIAGDLVVAGESAAFTMAYSKVGLSADGSSSWYLPRLIGMRRAQELMYTNRMLKAGEAAEWGLVNRVVSDESLMDAARELAQTVAQASPDSNAMLKTLLLTTYANGLETQMELEGQGIAACAGSVNGREGIAAFVEKRAPNFSD